MLLGNLLFQKTFKQKKRAIFAQNEYRLTVPKNPFSDPTFTRTFAQHSVSNFSKDTRQTFFH